MKKATALILLAALLLVCFAACRHGADPAPARPTAPPQASDGLPTDIPPIPEDAPQYTYTAAFLKMASVWDPHACVTEADRIVASFLTCPLVHRTLTDTETNVYEWVFEMAEEITDVTFTNRTDLKKYGCELGGADPDTVNEGYVFSVRLLPRAAWQDGTRITADSFIYSMRRLLDPEKNYKEASDFVNGPAAIAGGKAYYSSGETVFTENAAKDGIELSDLIIDADGNCFSPEGQRAFFAVDRPLSVLDGSTPKQLIEAYGGAFFPMEKWEELLSFEDENGLAPCTGETVALMKELFAGGDESELEDYLVFESRTQKADFDSVGIYKVDDHTFNFVCARPVSLEGFFVLMEKNWLVYEPYCEAGDYGTAPENTMSCGPYLMSSANAGRIVLVRNPRFFGWESGSSGDLISYTQYHVNGEHLRRFETTRVVFDRMTPDRAKEAFQKGELTEWTPGAADRSEYEKDRGLYKKSTERTVCLLIDPRLSTLAALDSSGGNTNSAVLSNLNFRLTLQICIDRARASALTAWDTPCLGLINENCLISGEPYRKTEPAMQAILDHYGAEYGEGTACPTLEAAYEALTGHDPALAGELMRTACEELTAEGLYKEGEEIIIRIAWPERELDEADAALCGLIAEYMNAAAADSGFGNITLVPVGNETPAAFSDGRYAMAFRLFDGSDPYGSLGVFLDLDYPGYIGEPFAAFGSEPLTLTIDGAEETMTRQEWARSLVFPGKYSDPSLECRTAILAELEKQCLERRCCIPLFTESNVRLLSEKAQFISSDPGDGSCWSSFETLAYNYNDADWEEYLLKTEG